MAPISILSRSFDDASNNTTNGIRGITHTLNQTPFRHLSIWAYFALGIILLAVTVVFGYFVFTCYRSAAVDVESTVDAPAQGDIYTEGRTSPRSGGRRKEKIQAKRRGIVAFSDKAKVFGRQSQETKEQPDGSNVITKQKKRQFKSPGLHITNVVDLSIRSYSSDGDSSYAIDNQSLPTPPRAYFHDSHRESSVKRPINSGAKSSMCPGTAPATPMTASKSSKSSFKLLKPVTASTTPKTPKTPTPALRLASPKDSSEIKYDSHNIRFILPREKSMESLENARLWRDPKLSPVGGNIIYPFPTSAPQQHMPCLSQQNTLGKQGASGAAPLGRGRTEKAKGRK